MEYRDIYNKDRIFTGRTAARSAKVESGDYIIVTHVCIFNYKGELLIQQRQHAKQKWGGLWDVSAAGAVMAGETSQLAAQRETAEELGLSLNLSAMRPMLTINFSFGFDDFYIVKHDAKLADLKLQKSEVVAVKWASLDEVLTMLNKERFVPYYSKFIELLFDLSGCPKSIIRTY